MMKHSLSHWLERTWCIICGEAGYSQFNPVLAQLPHAGCVS